MNDQNILRQLGRIYDELVAESRGPACDPDAVWALVVSGELPEDHHVHGCLACQSDAMQFRERLEQPRPAALLSFLLLTRKNEMMSEAGVIAPFSDDSTAVIRLEPAGPEAFRLKVKPLEVSLVADLDGVVLEVCGSGRPLERDETGYYVIELSRTEVEDPRTRFLLRLIKLFPQADAGETSTDQVNMSAKPGATRDAPSRESSDDTITPGTGTGIFSPTPYLGWAASEPQALGPSLQSGTSSFPLAYFGNAPHDTSTESNRPQFWEVSFPFNQVEILEYEDPQEMDLLKEMELLKDGAIGAAFTWTRLENQAASLTVRLRGALVLRAGWTGKLFDVEDKPRAEATVEDYSLTFKLSDVSSAGQLDGWRFQCDFHMQGRPLQFVVVLHPPAAT